MILTAEHVHVTISHIGFMKFYSMQPRNTGTNTLNHKEESVE